MINEEALRDALLSLAEQHKTNYVVLSAVLNEVAALRETVRGLDPTFTEVLEDRRIKSQEESRELTGMQIALFDEIIRRLKNGEVC
jgi:hypothetical protein